MSAKPARVLLDNGIIGAAELAEPATEEKTVIWGGTQQVVEVVGYKKKIASDASDQEEVDAIVTIGRLIREGAIAAYTYSELGFESIRRATPVRAFYALDGCHIVSCQAPIERSRFRQTVNLGEYISKGGKKDRKRNRNLGDFNQIPFFEWLLCLDDNDVQSILIHGSEIGLTEFEVESVRQLDRFKFICSGLRSPENYPDAFHLWTAERNNIACFLTLEKTLRNIADQMAKSRNPEHRLRVSVLRPIALLQLLGISDLDDVPIKADRFYDFTEGCK